MNQVGPFQLFSELLEQKMPDMSDELTRTCLKTIVAELGGENPDTTLLPALRQVLDQWLASQLTSDELGEV